MHACEGTCGHVCLCTRMYVHACTRACVREVEGVSYFNLHVLIFTLVDHPMTKPFSASLFHNIPVVCIYTLYSLFYICFT